MRYLVVLAAIATLNAQPSISELQPRGAQKGRPFTLTLAGKNLDEGGTIISSLPATFTPLAPEKTGMQGRYATFLVEPSSEWVVGTYPIRIKTATGISNILLFSIGVFPEVVEEESRPGALPHQNDSIEQAQTIPNSAVTLNGTLKGPERDFYRLQVKAGERRVFEVDARRCGSAIDPVIRVLDGSGNVIARSEDEPMLNLDARLDVTFPKDGFYYIEIHDARFSTQGQNFYRLKSGSYAYPSEIFPLGGRHGDEVEVSLSGTKVKADLTAVKTRQTFVNLPDSPALPLPFAVGTYPELQEPITAPLTLPVTVNARLSKPGEIDRYELPVKAGDQVFFRLQARELGTSKIAGLITVYDDKGKRLASAGDGPLPVDVAAVQVSSRTLGDPYLPFEVPEGVERLKITVEDLAQRGGRNYAYRLTVDNTPFDVEATILTPYVNIPAGGTALVTFNVERRGYGGPIRIEPIGLPEGVVAAGGTIPGELPDPINRTATRRAIVTLTARADTQLTAGEVGFRVIGTSDKGQRLERIASGIGYSITVAGATAQGVVDRQRPLTGAWLGYQLPVALTEPPPATLSLVLEKAEKKETGYEYRYRWTWNVRDEMQPLPEQVTVQVPNFIDFRTTEMAVDKENKKTGTFRVTSTKNTLPATYDIGISGRLMVGGTPEDIYSPLLELRVSAIEDNSSNATAPTAR